MNKFITPIILVVMMHLKRISIMSLIAIFSLSLVPVDIAVQAVNYDECDFDYAPLRTTSSSNYYSNLDCDYTSEGDYEVWDDYRETRISSSSHFDYYIYISSDRVGSRIFLKLSETADDWDGVPFDVDLELLSPSGSVIEGSYEGENIVEYISHTFTYSGYYKVRVERYSGAGDFLLERTLTENKGPAGELFVGAPKNNLLMHEKIYLDACETYDVGGGSVYYKWSLDNEVLDDFESCDMTLYLHDTEPHDVCLEVEDYYGKGFEECQRLQATDPFSGSQSIWNDKLKVNADSSDAISSWDKSNIYKAPGIDFYFKLGLRNDFEIRTVGSWDLVTSTSFDSNSITSIFSLENIDTSHNIQFKPTLTFEYYSVDVGYWQTLDVPIVSSEQVYAGQPAIDFFGKTIYYWDDYIDLSEVAYLSEDYSDSNSFVLSDILTLSEVDLYPLVRELLDYGTSGVRGASQFFDFMEEWSQISIPLSYDLTIGFAGIEYTGLLIKPIDANVNSVSESYNDGNRLYEEVAGFHQGNQLEIYEIGLAEFSPLSEYADFGDVLPDEAIFSSDDQLTDEVSYSVAQYSDIMIYSLVEPSINIGVESTFGNKYWTIYEFEEKENFIVERTSINGNFLHVALRDSDGDGVKNSEDQCIETPENIVVLSDGCPKSLIDRALTGQGDLIPVYGIAGGTLFAILLLFAILIKSGRKNKKSKRENFGMNNQYRNAPNQFNYSNSEFNSDFNQFGGNLITNQNINPPFVPNYPPLQPIQPSQNQIQDGGIYYQNQEMFVNNAEKVHSSESINELANDLGHQTPQPPPMGISGEIDSNGYEWIEYSEIWWWRIGPTHQWSIYQE